MNINYILSFAYIDAVVHCNAPDVLEFGPLGLFLPPGRQWAPYCAYQLGNGQKFLSRGLVPDVPIVTAGLTMRVGLTVTSLLHEVELVLGVNWLQLVNPIVD